MLDEMVTGGGEEVENITEGSDICCNGLWVVRCVVRPDMYNHLRDTVSRLCLLGSLNNVLDLRSAHGTADHFLFSA